MLVSALIPTYNYARFVGRAIDSVLAQTYADVECLVVDDGSTDETPAVLARYGDRIRVIRQQNRGLSAARNTAIGAARGDLVALLDADDEWKPEKLARQVEWFERTPGLAVVGCGTIVIDDDGRRVRHALWTSPGTGRTALRGIALREAWVGGSGSGALIRRAVFDEVGLFDESLTAAEDWDMWLRIAASHRIENVPEMLVTINKHGTGSFRNATKMETNQRRVYEAAVRRWPDAFDSRLQRRVRARIAADAGIELADVGSHSQAVMRYLQSLREWPLDRQTWYLAVRGLGKVVGV